jgi:16S rRNA C1402 (ribose-2'-O) methylase RsmI
VKIVGAQMSYHKFNEFARRDATVQRLKLGGILALISDAGMPGISDPGTDLVCMQFFILFYFISVSEYFLIS